MFKWTLILILMLSATLQVKAQTGDTTLAPIADTVKTPSDQMPDSIRTTKKAPENYGTITEIKNLNTYNAAEVLTQLKKGKTGHPINLAKDSVHWKKGGLFATNISQGSLQNWAAGGDNFSLALGFKGNFFANYADGRNSWDNNIDLGFGYLNTSSLGMRKSDDKINIDSKYGYLFSKHWSYSAMLSFRSQFANGYLYPDDSTIVSHFLAPAYVLASIGFNYQPVPYFSIFMSPITSRFVIVNDQRLADLGSYGVDSARYLYHDSTRTLISHGKKLQYQFGPYVSFQFNKDIVKNINWNARLDLYSNYLRDPQNIDIYFTSLFSLKVNKFITASLDTELIYDDDIKFITYAKNADGSVKTDPVTGDQVVLKKTARIQFKELIGIGFALQF
ncbi:MAG TPA: DUF3078 domain-containing protein [Chitinophagaceae bacterium]|nr:DUF3078 domain-containing protein [Chitinophagaceae bacterium]